MSAPSVSGDCGFGTFPATKSSTPTSVRSQRMADSVVISSKHLWYNHVPHDGKDPRSSSAHRHRDERRRQRSVWMRAKRRLPNLPCSHAAVWKASCGRARVYRCPKRQNGPSCAPQPPGFQGISPEMTIGSRHRCLDNGRCARDGKARDDGTLLLVPMRIGNTYALPAVMAR